MNINISLSKYGDELTINVSVPTDVEYADVTIDKIAINDNSKYTVEYPISPRIEISGSASGEFVLTNNKSYSKTFQIQTLIDNGLSATGLYFIYMILNLFDSLYRGINYIIFISLHVISPHFRCYNIFFF